MASFDDIQAVRARLAALHFACCGDDDDDDVAGAFDKTAAPNYSDYAARQKRKNKPVMKKDDWERKVLNRGKKKDDGGGAGGAKDDEPKDKGKDDAAEGGDDAGASAAKVKEDLSAFKKVFTDGVKVPGFGAMMDSLPDKHLGKEEGYDHPKVRALQKKLLKELSPDQLSAAKRQVEEAHFDMNKWLSKQPEIPSELPPEIQKAHAQMTSAWRALRSIDPKDAKGKGGDSDAAEPAKAKSAPPAPAAPPPAAKKKDTPSGPSKAPPGAPRNSPQELMTGWSDSSAAGKALNSVGKAIANNSSVEPSDVPKALEFVNNLLSESHFTPAEVREFKKMKTKLDSLNKRFERMYPDGAPKKKTYTKTYPAAAEKVMDKHSLTDVDADEVKDFVSDKPFKGVKITDAEKFRRFLANAKPETKKRMQEMSVADFMAILGAIMEDEDGGGGKTAATLNRLRGLHQACCGQDEVAPEMVAFEDDDFEDDEDDDFDDGDSMIGEVLFEGEMASHLAAEDSDLVAIADNLFVNASGSAVAQTIMEQLGGNRTLMLMLGAKHFLHSPNSLSFQFPNRTPTKGNYLKVTLRSDDTYDMEFMSVRKFDAKTVKKVSGVFAEDMPGIFQRQTGLDLRVPVVVRVPTQRLAAGSGPDPKGRNWTKRENPTRWLWEDRPNNIVYTVSEKPGPGRPIYVLLVLNDHGMFKHANPYQWLDPMDAFKAAAASYRGMAGETVFYDMTTHWLRARAAKATDWEPGMLNDKPIIGPDEPESEGSEVPDGNGNSDKRAGLFMRERSTHKQASDIKWDHLFMGAVSITIPSPALDQGFAKLNALGKSLVQRGLAGSYKVGVEDTPTGVFFELILKPKARGVRLDMEQIMPQIRMACTKKTAEEMTTLYALVASDGYLLGATDNLKLARTKTYWLTHLRIQKHQAEDHFAQASLVTLADVPLAVAQKLSDVGTRAQTFSDGYAAWSVAKKFVVNGNKQRVQAADEDEDTEKTAGAHLVWKDEDGPHGLWSTAKEPEGDRVYHIIQYANSKFRWSLRKPNSPDGIGSPRDFRTGKAAAKDAEQHAFALGIYLGRQAAKVRVSYTLWVLGEGDDEGEGEMISGHFSPLSSAISAAKRVARKTGKHVSIQEAYSGDHIGNVTPEGKTDIEKRAGLSGHFLLGFRGKTPTVNGKTNPVLWTQILREMTGDNFAPANGQGGTKRQNLLTVVDDPDATMVSYKGVLIPYIKALNLAVQIVQEGVGKIDASRLAPLRGPGQFEVWLGSASRQAKEAGTGMYGYTKAMQQDIEAASKRIAKEAIRIARTAHGKDARVADFLTAHAKRGNSVSAKALVTALQSLAPKLASDQNERLQQLREANGTDKTAGSGAANAKFLAGVSPALKNKILTSIAKHYGVSVSDIEKELTDREAEELPEYIGNDRALQMQVYQQFKQMRLGSHEIEAKYGLYGFRAKTSKLGLNACSEMRHEAGRIGSELHRRRQDKHAQINDFLKTHTKEAGCHYSTLLLQGYPDATMKLASVPEPKSVQDWISWEE